MAGPFFTFDNSFTLVSGAEQFMSQIITYFNTCLTATDEENNKLFMSRIFLPLIKRIIAIDAANLLEQVTDAEIIQGFGPSIESYPIIPLFCINPDVNPKDACVRMSYAVASVPWSENHPDYKTGQNLFELRITFNYQWMRRAGLVFARIGTENEKQSDRTEIKYHKVIALDKLLLEFIHCFTEIILDFCSNFLTARGILQRRKYPATPIPAGVKVEYSQTSSSSSSSSSAKPTPILLGDMGYGLHEALTEGMRLKLEYSLTAYGWYAKGIFIEKAEIVDVDNPGVAASFSLPPAPTSTTEIHEEAVETSGEKRDATAVASEEDYKTPVKRQRKPKKASLAKKTPSAAKQTAPEPIDLGRMLITYWEFEDPDTAPIYCDIIIGRLEAWTNSQTPENAKALYDSFSLKSYDLVKYLQEPEMILNSYDLLRKSAPAGMPSGGYMYGEDAVSFLPSIPPLEVALKQTVGFSLKT